MDYPAQPYKPSKGPGFYILIVMGVGCGALLLAFLVLAAVLFPVFAQARENARAATCLSNLKQQGLSLSMYLQDYDETFPESGEWMSKLSHYTLAPSTLHCPTVSKRDPGIYGYAYNAGLSGAPLSGVSDPKTSVSLYDSTDLGRSASDKLTSLPKPGRHYTPGGKGNNMAYADGHAHAVTD